ncbi:MAG: cob(I)yrinic acid a,c-diamide adenosyltransferase [Bacteroidales bacterium]|jgi:cob(I)alamin adenosyltransferase|nr:cob(I)yrinic acid a,c-diamide adenosyltransferase [Bacteroidales bacterium]MDD4213263.1 cob(I)yrinic acid a,c-diamide adenosyltransferase [Bacteroidales bacterium]
MAEKIKKIYTKTGDEGNTSLLGGTIIKKSDLRVEAYGALDELNSYIGLVRDFAIEQEMKEILLKIQEHVFIAESMIAADTPSVMNTLPKLNKMNISMIEQEIDKMAQTLVPQHNFILPGGHPLVSYCHIVRTVCRRAERCIVRIENTNEYYSIIIKYINRLSDYFFILARYITKELGIEENYWKP